MHRMMPATRRLGTSSPLAFTRIVPAAAIASKFGAVTTTLGTRDAPWNGRHPLPLVLVDDVAHAFVLAMGAPGIEGRAFNLVGDVRPTAAEMIRFIGQRSRRQVTLHTQPITAAFAVDTAKWAVKRAIGRTERRPDWRSYRARQLTTQFDCSAAKRLLGWRPCADLEVLLREAIDPHLRPVPPGDLRNEPPLALCC